MEDFQEYFQKLMINIKNSSISGEQYAGMCTGIIIGEIKGEEAKKLLLYENNIKSTNYISLARMGKGKNFRIKSL